MLHHYIISRYCFSCSDLPVSWTR